MSTVPTPLSVAEAAAHVAAGGLLGLPTETVYGLAADADQPEAVAQIFTAKGRPADHPLIVHVLGQEQAQHYAAQWPDFAEHLAQAFWPGPLTLIVPRQPERAAAAAGGQSTVGLRAPAHPVARELLQACAALGVQGLAAPSANRFGRISPTTAAHVQAEFGSQVPVLDGGPCAVGIESTIVDCSRGQAVLLRPGQISAAAIDAVLAPLGMALQDPNSLAQQQPKASGTLAAHYAPQAKLRLMDAALLQTALDVLGPEAKNIAIYSRSLLRLPNQQVLFRLMPQEAEAAAQELFAALRELDAQGVNLIWVETPPADADWDGVRDRLQRAAAA